MKKALFLGLLAIGLVGISPAQQKKQPTKKEAGVKPEEVRQVLLSGFEQDPKFLWKIEQDESQRICSQYPSMEAMPAQAVQKVIELENKNIKYPQWGIAWGDWKEGKKLVESARGGRFASYGFSDKPTDKGGNCYACHLIEKGVPGGTMGPQLTGYGKRYEITKENMNTPEGLEKLKTVYKIIYNAWHAFPCSSMPRFGYHGALSPEDVMNIATYLLHPESPVNK
jgi:sulfur-oxidizing protein SoxX